MTRGHGYYLIPWVTEEIDEREAALEWAEEAGAETREMEVNDGLYGLNIETRSLGLAVEFTKRFGGWVYAALI